MFVSIAYSGGEESTGSACPIAATAAAPANWRGTNDSASEYNCRRGNTPAAYSRYQRNNANAPYSTPPSNVERYNLFCLYLPPSHARLRYRADSVKLAST